MRGAGGARPARQFALTAPDEWVIEPLDRRHDRTTFFCGLPELDRYLAHRSGQDVRRRIARVFVCTAGEADAVLGFYTLSALPLDLASPPEELARKLPRHPVPCALIGRLAVDASVHGRGVGSLLLADAVKRVAAAGETVAMHALIVGTANDAARRFYEGLGFAPLTDDPMRLFLALGPAPRGTRKHSPAPRGNPPPAQSRRMSAAMLSETATVHGGLCPERDRGGPGEKRKRPNCGCWPSHSDERMAAAVSGIAGPG